jgi:aldehyde dehydrogenase (NAD+)
MSEHPQGEPRMLIDGRLVQARSGATFENVNPATEATIGQVADGGPAEMDAAIAAARRAFDETDWSRNHAMRRACLEQLQQALEREKDALRMQTVAEAGAPIQLTYGPQGDAIIEDAKWPIRTLAEYRWERQLPERTFFGITSRRTVWKEAGGVVGAITPWNYPLQVNLAKVFPALAAGNTVVLKPAPETPWNATFVGRLVAEHTDIPAGVFNVVTSADRVAVGRMLVQDPRVDMISFTGSTETGKRVMADASETVKKVFLELGGKSAHIFLDDADFPSLLPMAVMVCVHAGQGCAMLTRLLLPRTRYAEGIEILRAAFAHFPYGDPMDASNLMGPLISARQRERVLGYVDKGKREGARLVCGGKRPAHLERGFYVEPTLFADVDNSMSIAREEIFGPVLAVLRYEDEDDAIRIANDSIYGLSGGVTSGSEERALGVARRLRTGTVGINGGLWFGPDSPFGGYKQSGVGREMGLEGFEEYLQTKSIGMPA